MLIDIEPVNVLLGLMTKVAIMDDIYRRMLQKVASHSLHTQRENIPYASCLTQRHGLAADNW